MEPEVPKPKNPRRWRRSLIVLLIGLAYLAAVYLLVPETHPRSEFLRGTRYGPGLRGFEQRLIERAAKIERLRMTVVWESRRGEPVVGKLLLDRGDRILLDVKCGERWRSALLHNGPEGWFMEFSLEDSRFVLTRFETKGFDFGSKRAMFFVSRHQVALLYPYVAPDELSDLLRSSRVTLLGERRFRGKPCQVVRIDRRERIVRKWVHLWILQDEQRIVKTESSWGFRFGLLAGLRKWRKPTVVSVVAEFEADARFDDSEFDPVPLIRDFADAVKRGTDETLTTEELLRGEPAEPGSDGAEDVGEN
jgi:hypothetical protein